jgi:hypothetical protein
LDDGGDTPCANEHHMSRCGLHMCMCHNDHAEVVLTLFRSMGSKISLEFDIRTTGIKGSATEVVASGFEPSLVCCLFKDLTACSSGN